MSVWWMIPKAKFEELFPDESAAYEAFLRLGGNAGELYDGRELNEIVFEVFAFFIGAGMVKGHFTQENVSEAVQIVLPGVRERMEQARRAQRTANKTANFGKPTKP